MQKNNLIFSSENVISSKQLAEDLQVAEEFIIKLCKKDLLQAKYFNNDWVIVKNQELPCLIQFKNVDSLDKVNSDILNGQYKIEDMEALAYWPTEVFEEEYLGFQHVCIDKGVFKDASGNLYSRYTLEIETFLKVAKWADSMETVLLKAEEVIIYPKKSEFVAVFNSEAEAFKYAHKLYPEFPLEY